MKTRFTKTLEQVAEYYEVSKRTVTRWVETGMLKYGVEYIDLRVSNARHSRLRFDLGALDKVFSTPPEKR